MSLQDLLSKFQVELEKDDIAYLNTTLEDDTLSETEIRELVIPILQDKLSDWKGLVDCITKRIAIEETDDVPSCQIDVGASSDNNIKKSAKPIDSPYKCSTDEYMEETWSSDSKTRRLALRTLCPCKVKSNVQEFWSRIISMIDDPDPNVRYQVLHNLCDGSPNEMEEEVIAAIERLHNDPDKYIRRRCHQVLVHYRKTGKWNIM